MPEYYRSIELNFGNEEISFGFYYDSKKHRYLISINYGEEYINVTRKEGETILAFLKILKDFLGSRNNLRIPRSGSSSKDSSSRSDSRDVERALDFLEEAAASKISSTPKEV
uniref:Uncharacterized protein n=1 Tax=Pleomorphic virus ThalV2 TaxID=3115753 RepID=A0AAT9JBD7_9VIRU